MRSRLGERGQVAPGDLDAAGGRRVHPAEDVLERRLAAPGRADDRDQLAGLDAQVEALERDDLEVGDLVDLDQVLAEDRGSGISVLQSCSTWSSRARRIRAPATTTATTASATTPTANSTGGSHGTAIGFEPLPV